MRVLIVCGIKKLPLIALNSVQEEENVIIIAIIKQMK
jgi:hypothetical protein